jgi:ribonuclease HI
VTSPAPPPILKRGRYLLNTDAGMSSSGHPASGDEPGEAAIGGVLNDPNDRIVTTFSERIGKETIQGAEYRALIKGLELAVEHGIKHIRAYMDNQILVDQINDRAKLKSERLKPLHTRAIDLLDQIGDWRVYWVPRKRNRQADALATAALNS